MGLEFINKLPTPAEIREQFPIPAELAALKEKRDAEIRKVITGESDKFLVIIGPCSADNETAVLDYTSRLVKVQDKVKSAIENMTGLTVLDVNIKIAGVSMEENR